MIVDDNHVQNALSKKIYEYKYHLLEFIKQRDKLKGITNIALDTKIAMYKMFIDDMENIL